MRTFSLLGLASGIAGLIAAAQPLVAGGRSSSAMLGYLAIAYAPKLQGEGRRDQPGCRRGDDRRRLPRRERAASAWRSPAAAIIVLILALRDELHGFVDRLDEKDVKALARFAVIALAVLPFLPDERFRPLRRLERVRSCGGWSILVTGFSFAGYVANRIFGARHGTIATALIGGAYSSTAVTQSLAQRLGSSEQGGAEPAGIALASAVMYLRVMLLVAVLATRIAVPFADRHRPGADRRLAGRLVALSHRRRTRKGRRRRAIRSRWSRR